MLDGQACGAHEMLRSAGLNTTNCEVKKGSPIKEMTSDGVLVNQLWHAKGENVSSKLGYYSRVKLTTIAIIDHLETIARHNGRGTTIGTEFEVRHVGIAGNNPGSVIT